MKFKRFISGIFAAVMSIVFITAPLSTAIAAEIDPDLNENKCIITINHAASTGTYTAYPIFVGNVEMEKDNDGNTTGRKLISNLKFHENLETKINSGQVASRTENDDYGLWKYLKNDTKVNTQGFFDLIKAYDPNTSFTGFSMSLNPNASLQAEALANILNLTSSDTAVTTILGNGNYSSFYSAFAEAARVFMVDSITDGTKGTLTGTANGMPNEGSDSITIEVSEPGYYMVEYTPENYSEDYEKTPRAVRRSLVLVGKGTELSATINSKDTQNIASVDVQFNKNILDKATCEVGDGENATYSYPDDVANADAEENWAKNVSAGNGDYVNCRVVVTLPGNFTDYEQYYLAVPIMYGYNQTGSSYFDYTRSITRQTDGTDKTKNVKVYFLNDSNKNEITFSEGNNFTVNESYTYANDKTDPTGGVTADRFFAKETFVFTDIANINVISEEGNTTLAKNSGYNKLVIEFPVKFERFSNNNLPTGVSSLGFNGSAASAGYYTGDDALLKNYITAKAVYSNNPNLKALAESVDETKLSNSEKLYLDTTKPVGTLQNPVGVAKESSANIVTYRLRVHVTTEDLKDLSQAGGVEGVRFVLKDNNNGKYAIATTFTGNIDTYDTVNGEILRDNGSTAPSSSNQGKVRVYKITGWADDYYNDTTEGDGERTLNDDCVLKTFNASVSDKGIYSNNNSARFEIIGLAPGNYTIFAFDEAIKTYEVYKGSNTDGDYKEYAISKEDGKPKTEYGFSFAPTLSETCIKQLYNTHYAPSNFDLNTLYSGLFNNNGEYILVQPTYHSVNTSGLITNFNMKWYDMEGNEIAKENADWWLGQREDVALMSMRITYIKKGLSLPVTGGIGTFIFYSVGGALVVISMVAIITKIRIKREQLW